MEQNAARDVWMDSEERPGRPKRNPLWGWLGAFAIVVVLYVAAVQGYLWYERYRGREVIAFCNTDLVGKSAAEIIERARQAGLETRERDDLIVVSIRGREGRIRCYLEISAGKATRAKSYHML